ncbi:MAG: hypothetical protein H5T86_04860 [Armatimonadetes bacterium]|nr:hypothetical protein [Armatimonadota bacterium]
MVQAAGQPFAQQFVYAGGQWKRPEEALREAPEAGTLLDVTPDVPSQLRYASDAPQLGHSVTVEAAPPQVGGRVLHARLDQVRSWANWAASVPENVMPENAAITFWARGGDNTSHLVVELSESDQSRWLTAVELATQWRKYVLTPHDFQFWHDCPARGKRGYSGDALRPQCVTGLAFGLAKSHAPVTPGPKEFWLSSLRFSVIPPDAMPARQYIPELDAIAPWYKTFDHPNVRQLRTAPGTVWSDARLQHSGKVRSAYPRPWGRVMTGIRTHRWVPILEAVDLSGRHSYPAALVVPARGRFAGGSWSFWGLPVSVLKSGGSRLQKLFGEVAAAQARGVWLVEAGPDQVAYMPKQAPRWGAVVVNSSAKAAPVEIVLRARRDGRPAGTLEKQLSAAPAQLSRFLEAWKAEGPGVYEVTAELRQDGRVIDRISMPVRVLSGQPDPQDQYVRVEGGRFWVGNKTWFPHGVNFWPRYVSGLSPHDYGLGWLHRAHYDPLLVEEDLSIAEGLGITAVSIQSPRSPDDLPCLWDFLARCRAHDIRVNLFVHADPRGFDRDDVRNIIAGGELWKFSSIYAYDITWEPRWGDYQERCRFDEFWRRWIIDQYGSVEAAEEVWGFKAPRGEDGRVTGPTDDQLDTDGPWKVFVAAYRRFVDDFLSAGYGRSCRFIRSIDNRHLISNRAGWGGTGNPHTVRIYQFDPLSGAAHLDFISPEAYGMRPDEGDYKRWGFIDAYCRRAGNGKPVFWSEFGSSIYPGYTREDYERQRRIWANTLELVMFAGADGDAGWWWPGGYRVNERSDYGCVEPRGEPRPSALELKKYSARICQRGVEVRPERTLIIDRDQDVRGLAGLWQRHLEDYIHLADGKHVVRLRTAGDGIRTTDLEPVGVGNVSYRGIGPVKFLRSEFTDVVAIVRGREYRPEQDLLWREIELRVPAGEGALRVTVLNTGEATWVAPADREHPERGSVHLVDCSNGRRLAAIPHDVPRYASATVELPLPTSRAAELVLQLEAAQRCRFGQKLTVRIWPR